MTIPHFSKSIGRSPSRRCCFVLIPLVLCCFALIQNTQAALPPPAPDGGYPGGNTAEGDNALFNVSTGVGINNTAVGANALRDDTTGAYNVAVGSGALANNTTGNFNMAIGAGALLNNTANFNLAIGYRVGFMNTTGNHLTGIGAAAMRNNTTAGFNTAIGADALRENTTSGLNVAVGDSALTLFNGGVDAGNTALGSIALTALTSGIQNTAVGRRALESLAAGNNNTAVGWRSGDSAATGDSGVFIGSDAGFNVTTGSNIIAIGAFQTGIDNPLGQLNNSCYIANIAGQPISAVNFVGVVGVDSSGKLGTFSVDANGNRVPLSSLQGNPQAVPESQFPQTKQEAMLNRKVEKLQAAVTQQQQEIGSLKAQLKEQAAQIQKVSAQVEMSKSAAKVVNNNE
jgi:hypothetical protein